MTEEWNVGGTSIIRAKSTNPLIQEATPLTVEVDVPVHSLGVELVTTTGTKIGTVSARNLKNYMKTLAEGEEDKKVVELAVGSVGNRFSHQQKVQKQQRASHEKFCLKFQPHGKAYILILLMVKMI